MKRVMAFGVIVGLLVFAGLGTGSPLKGSRGFTVKVSGQSEGSGKYEFKELFRGGQRACVIAKGDHKPVVDVGIHIYDAADKLVAKDVGRGDFAAVIWYPPRDAMYKIVVQNAGNEWNECYIVVK